MVEHYYRALDPVEQQARLDERRQENRKLRARRMFGGGVEMVPEAIGSDFNGFGSKYSLVCEHVELHKCFDGRTRSGRLRPPVWSVYSYGRLVTRKKTKKEALALGCKLATRQRLNP